jgi:inosine/xanthosine triphosphate pyrophosphatase family protein
MIYLQTFEVFLPKFALVTSNARKIREYRELIPNLRVEEGQDLPEVDADDETVAIYKAVDNGPYTISEDTSLEVEGENIGVNLKWFKEKIPTFVGKKAYWKVLLAKNDGEYIKVYEGFVEGEIVASQDTSSFDKYFKVTKFDQLLGELKMTDTDPALYSARAMAAKNLKEDRYIVRKRVKYIPEWTGKYQNS